MWETTRRTTPWLKIPLINTMFSPQDLWLDSTDIGVPYIYTLVLGDFTRTLEYVIGRLEPGPPP